MIAIGAGVFLVLQEFNSTPRDRTRSIKTVETLEVPIPESTASLPTEFIARNLHAGLVSPSAEPIVPLYDSDSSFRHALSGLMGDRALGQFFVTHQMVRKLVATVDNLPSQAASMQMRTVEAMPGHFETSTSTGVLSIAPTNTTRYAGFIDAVSMVNLKGRVQLYATHCVLFQQAHRELGYPRGNFNDRLLVAYSALPQVKPS